MKRVYIKNNEHNYRYPDEMERILAYLAENGSLAVSGPVVEQMYRDFSEECYSAGWMVATPEILEEFADWLAEIEI